LFSDIHTSLIKISCQQPFIHLNVLTINRGIRIMLRALTMKYADEFIDELLRRAADKYPLSIKPRKWNKVLFKLRDLTKSEKDVLIIKADRKQG
jgi:hypothetical protein